tara:strand:+ start:3611 stop:3958 length:348 start_codon:yes stop_codon:yes gene_type:complete
MSTGFKGKGSKQRPLSVDHDTFSNQWDAIFMKDKEPISEISLIETYTSEDGSKEVYVSLVTSNSAKVLPFIQLEFFVEGEMEEIYNLDDGEIDEKDLHVAEVIARDWIETSVEID